MVNPTATSVNAIAPAYSRRHASLAERLLMTALLCDTLVIIYGLAAGFWLRFYTPIAKYGVLKSRRCCAIGMFPCSCSSLG
jgi:hypothetical protein